MDKQNVFLRVLQVGFGIFFLYTGMIHFIGG